MSQDKIPKEQLNQLKKAFDIFDINGDGDITLQVLILEVFTEQEHYSQKTKFLLLYIKINIL